MINKIILIALLSAVAGGGYWLGIHQATSVTTPASAVKVERKILYYRNPMGLPDTSPVPKKDGMGMDYVAVYAGEEQAAGGVSINADKVQKLGVTSEAAQLRELKQTLRASGRIEIDERRTYTIAPKFEGWIERLFVNASGETVTKGQPLFEVYSPELVSAQHEQSLANQGVTELSGADSAARDSMKYLAAASAARLNNWDVDGKQAVRDRITYRAPINGVVMEKKAIQGMRFMPGDVLYQIADLSTLWVIADVPEQQIAAVTVGSTAQLSVDAYPGKSFEGRVDFVYPKLNSATRTVPVRIVISNAKGVLKPAMFAQVELSTGHHNKVLTVPNSAVIDSGIRQVVLVQLAEGRFEPRDVRLGSRGENYVEILSGIVEGEQVVTQANFLIDAESNLKAVLSGMSNTNKAAVHVEKAASIPEQKVFDHAGTLSTGHQARGVLNMINKDGTVNITHEAIDTLNWPGMTMDFPLANSSLIQGVAPGSAVSFELVERKPDEWVITKLQTAKGH